MIFAVLFLVTAFCTATPGPPKSNDIGELKRNFKRHIHWKEDPPPCLAKPDRQWIYNYLEGDSGPTVGAVVEDPLGFCGTSLTLEEKFTQLAEWACSEYGVREAGQGKKWRPFVGRDVMYVQCKRPEANLTALVCLKQPNAEEQS